MNAVLDVLRLRRIKLDYVSPPICQVILSGSGSSLMLEAVTGPEPPSNLAFTGECDRFLTWTNPRNAACVTLYKAVNPNDPVTQYLPVTDCVPEGFVSVCSPGWWTYRTFSELGDISDLSTPVYVPGGSQVNIQIVQIPGAVRFELYKNPIPTVPLAPSHLVLSSTSFHAIEVCTSTGCYRAQVITDDGPSSLSGSICRTSVLGCCPAPGCPAANYWDNVVCSCVPGTLISDVFCPLSSACIGEAYSDAMTVLGGESPYLWELISGSVPPGLNLHTGLFAGQTAPITGTPAVGGSYPFTVRCTSTDGSFFERTCTIRVLAFTQGAILPGAVTDTAYSEQLVAIGGEAPFSFALESGSLPTGFSMDAAGLITGSAKFSESASFSVAVTDADGRECVIPEILQVTGCPNVTTWPTITVTGETTNTVTEVELDRQRRILWIPEGGYRVSPPYQVVHVVDTYTNTYLGLATDSSNYINSASKGENYRCAIIDTKYNQFITGGGVGWFSFYDLTTRNCTGVGQINFGVQSTQDYLAYDSLRGYLYRESPTIGGFLQMNTFNCDPAVLAVIASTGNTAGFTSSSIVYSPGADMVYLANSAGPNLFHKWDPTTGVYTTNTGPAIGVATSQVRHIAVLDLLMFNSADGKLRIIDPNNGDNLVATITFGGGFAISGSIDYNDCNGLVYTSSETMNSKIKTLDPSNGWAVVELPGVGLNEFYAFAFDPLSNRLYTNDRGTGIVHTY